jgi:23S rRNA (adenine2503-C2)-methyltransferase
VETLERGGIVVTVRKRKGADIDAACGQLRINAQKGELESVLPVLQAN